MKKKNPKKTWPCDIDSHFAFLTKHILCEKKKDERRWFVLSPIALQRMYRM